MSKIPSGLTVLVFAGVVGLAMIEIVWVVSTMTSLVTCRWIATTYEDADVNHFILDKGGSCFENEQDKIFFLRTWQSINLIKLRTLR